MLPFVRTARELARCRELIAESGLLDRRGFELWVMAEVPSVLFNLERYAELGVAGISIGSNDLTQLLLGADRDSELLAETLRRARPGGRRLPAPADPGGPRARAFRPRSAARRPRSIRSTRSCSCEPGIDAISVNMDVVDRTRRLVAAAERRVLLDVARGGAA